MSENLYMPSQSQISENSLADFLRSPIIGDLIEVPGISPSNAKLLNRGGDVTDRITNTYQLIGKFLMLKTLDKETNSYITQKQHCNAFYDYLKNKGITSHRHSIVLAIAEKANTLLPGIYDANDFYDN